MFTFMKIRYGQIDKSSSECVTRLMTKEELLKYGVNFEKIKMGCNLKKPKINKFKNNNIFNQY